MSELVFPAEHWQCATAEEVGMRQEALEQARLYALTGEGSGYITRHGRLVMSWGDPWQVYDLKSTTKSIGVTALGLAIGDGLMAPDERARVYHSSLGVPPESNLATGWLDEITLHHLATQTAGFRKPGGYTELIYRPGTEWHYSDGGPNWLAECITLTYKQDLYRLMTERVFAPLGIAPSALRWRNNAYRPATIEGIPNREFGAGIHACVDAMARIGYLYLRNGRWGDKQIIPQEFVARASAPDPAIVGLPVRPREDDRDAWMQPDASSNHYGWLWWNNGDGSLSTVPRDAYWSWGLYDSLIVVIPSLDIVVARAGKSWPVTGTRKYDVLAPFLGPIAESVRG